MLNPIICFFLLICLIAIQLSIRTLYNIHIVNFIYWIVLLTIPYFHLIHQIAHNLRPKRKLRIIRFDIEQEAWCIIGHIYLDMLGIFQVIICLVSSCYVYIKRMKKGVYSNPKLSLILIIFLIYSALLLKNWIKQYKICIKRIWNYNYIIIENWIF